MIPQPNTPPPTPPIYKPYNISEHSASMYPYAKYLTNSKKKYDTSAIITPENIETAMIKKAKNNDFIISRH